MVNENGAQSGLKTSNYNCWVSHGFIFTASVSKHVDDHLDVVFDTSLLRAENLVLSPRYAMVMCFGFLTFGTSVSGTLGPVRRKRALSAGR